MIARLYEPRWKLAGALAGGSLLLLAWVSGWAPAAWASLAIGSFYGVRPAIESFASGRVNIDVLMVVGAGLAAWVGKPGEGALLLFLFTLSGALEALASERTARSVRALERLMPAEAVVRRGGAWVRVPSADLAPGDEVLVASGELIAADSVVLDASTEIDESSLTGESLPRAAGPGDEVFSGTINVANPIRARVLRPASESSIQRIVSLVERARAQREPVQRVIDRLGPAYAAGVFAFAALVLGTWRLALDRPWQDSIFTAITLLIVASPCALVIATPTATLAGISRGARARVLFKGGQSIERLARIGAIGLDKTGTLTTGRLRLDHVAARGLSDGDALALAGALESGSTHPIALGIVRAARSDSHGVRVESITHVPGRGISGIQRLDPRPLGVRLGNPAHARSLVPGDPWQADLDAARAQGSATAILAREDAAWALFSLRDEPRPGSRTLVASLHALGVSPVVMLTGDHPTPASRVARECGIDEVRSELLPEAKVAAIADLRARARRPVAIIGDGVNDAPALAAADASIAIGSIGSGAALESADIVLVGEDLAAVPWAVALARRTRRTIRLNFGVALGVIGVMVAWTLHGSWSGRPVPLSLGVLAHEGSTLLVVLNSLTILAHRGPRDAG